MTKVLIIKYGEIALRKKNRGIYENMLLHAIKRNLAAVEDVFIRKEQGRFIIESDNAERLAPHALEVFGVVAVAVGIAFDDTSLEHIKAQALDFAKANGLTPHMSFKVATRRGDKAYPIVSNEVSRLVGAHIFENIDNLQVNLTKPDYTLNIEVRNKAYIYSKEQGGLGGLPPGSAGKGILLLSGGIDSPVAGYLAAKRGVGLTCLYFHSPPYTSERAKEKVVDLAKALSRYVSGITLFVVDFTEIQLKLVDNTPPEKITIMLKRTMLRIAQAVAEREGALSLVTGDSIGQVASQTLHSLAATSSGISLPIIRPLATYDKHEIITIAQKIKTFDISIRPFDDCCAIFLPKHPETKPKTSIIERIEARIDLEQEITKAISTLDKVPLD